MLTKAKALFAMSRRSQFLLLGVLGLLIFALPAGVHQLNAFKVHGFPLGFFSVAHIAIVSCAILMFAVGRAPSRGRVHGIWVGFGFAAAVLSAPIILLYPGLLYELGYDGLMLGLACIAGLLLSAMWFVPEFSAHRVRTFSGYAAQRFQSPTAAWLVFVVAALVMVLFLAALLAQAADMASDLVSFDKTKTLLLLALTIFLTSAFVNIGSDFFRSSMSMSGVVAVILVLAIAAWAGFVEFGSPLPQLGYGHVLEALGVSERAALVAGFADPVTFKTHARPEVHYSLINFAALTFCLMLGVAVMPHLFSSAPFTEDQQNFSFSWAMSWAVFAVALLLITIPALTVFAKSAVFQNLIGQSVSRGLPGWLWGAGVGVEVAEICGSRAADLPSIEAACRAVPDAVAGLRVDDVKVSNGQVIPMVLASSNAPLVLWICFALTVTLAFLATTVAVVRSICLSVSETSVVSEQDRTRWLQWLVASFAFIAMAAVLAFFSKATPVDLMIGALSILAGAFAPMLIASLWWSGMTGVTAIVGVVSGAIVSALYWGGITFVPAVFFSLSEPLSNASFYAIEDFKELLSVWRVADGNEKAQAWIAMNEYARPLANWWGLTSGAAGLIALPVSCVAMVISAMAEKVLGWRS